MSTKSLKNLHEVAVKSIKLAALIARFSGPSSRVRDEVLQGAIPARLRKPVDWVIAAHTTSLLAMSPSTQFRQGKRYDHQLARINEARRRGAHFAAEEEAKIQAELDAEFERAKDDYEQAQAAFAATADERRAAEARASDKWLARHYQQLAKLAPQYEASFAPFRVHLAGITEMAQRHFGDLAGEATSATEVGLKLVRAIASRQKFAYDGTKVDPELIIVSIEKEIGTLMRSAAGSLHAKEDAADPAKVQKPRELRVDYRTALAGSKKHRLPPTPTSTLRRWATNPKSSRDLGVDGRGRVSAMQFLVDGLRRLHDSKAKNRRPPGRKNRSS